MSSGVSDQMKISGSADNKKYTKPIVYNNFKREDSYQTNAWGSNYTRKINSDIGSNNSYKINRYDNDNKFDDRNAGRYDTRLGLNNVQRDEKKSFAPAHTSAPKKTTWASIASQPAKLTSRATLTTFSHMKKGPGMPPPPMVPGKHNFDVNTWDVPNNNPPPVPSPPTPPADLGNPYYNPDFPPNTGRDFNVGTRHERVSGNSRIPYTNKDEHKSSNHGPGPSPNFGLGRNPTNENSRKWLPHSAPPLSLSASGGNMMQHHQTRPYSDGGLAFSGSGGVGVAQNRYHERNKPTGANYSAQQYNEPPATNETNREGNTERALESPQHVLNELCYKNNYNPTELDLETAATARFFVIKSYSEDDIHRSIKYEIWCSTDHGNKRLDDAFMERQNENGHIFLFFSVNGSGHFCGMAQMITAVDYNSTSSVWAQDKWKGKFKVKWIYVKDVPNSKLRHIILENNENKPVTNSRDTQEVPTAQGIEVLQILHSYKHSTSLFDDFYHYEKKQEEEVSYKKPNSHHSPSSLGGGGGGGVGGNGGSIIGGGGGGGRHYNYRQNDDRDRSIKKPPSLSYREKGNMSRGNSGSGDYEYRRYESGRAPYSGNIRDEGIDRERGNNDYVNNSGNSRYMTKHEYRPPVGNDRLPPKSNNRERDFLEQGHKNDGVARQRSTSREIVQQQQQPQKDIEFNNTFRNVGNDY